jgi:CheY-like chemotaxis protein
MPVMDGLSACRAIRELEARRGSARTPVIALSASVLNEDRAAALDAGMDGFACKPLDLDALTREIARVTGCTPLGVAAADDAHVAEDDHDAHLDPVAGAKRWGDRASWMGALQRFARAQAPLDDGLDAQAQKATAHRLRGAAANLGLPHLTRVAGVVEGLHADAPTEQRQAAWGDLKNAMAATLQTIDEATDGIGAHASGSPAPAVGATTPTTHAEAARPNLLRQAGALRSAFERGECQDDELDALCEAWRPHANANRLAALKQAADDFDFDAAASLIAALIGELSPTEAMDHA